MNRDDANGIHRPSQEHHVSSDGSLYPRSPAFWQGHELGGSPTPSHAQVITQERAKTLVRTVAAHLVAEHALGSFGRGETAWCNEWLSGACCIATAITAAVLQHEGFTAVLVGGKPPPEYRGADDKPGQTTHWWVHTANGWLLDPTWGQFRCCIDPLAVHVTDPASKALHAMEVFTLEEIMSWHSHASLPAENRIVVDKILSHMTGALYAWE